MHFWLIVAALFVAATYPDDITLPLRDGNIVIRAQFIRPDGVPELAVKIKNQPRSSWRTLKLQFDMGGLCNGEARQWTVPVVTSLGWAEDHQIVTAYTDTVSSLIGKVDGCKTEIINARLLFAENSKARIEGVSGDRVDLERQLRELKAKREAEAAAQAEEERRAAEAQAKKEAAEAARRKRLAAEQKKRETELNGRLARERAVCAVIYRNTANKKVSDLTVDEEQKVRACQALGMYRP